MGQMLKSQNFEVDLNSLNWGPRVTRILKSKYYLFELFCLFTTISLIRLKQTYKNTFKSYINAVVEV